jgi:MFS family permease
MNKLDKLIGDWRNRLANSEAIFPQNIDELEDHLRVSISNLMEQGLSDEEAFFTSARRIGTNTELDHEFRKVNVASVGFHRSRWLAFVTMFVATIICSIIMVSPAPFIIEIMKSMNQASVEQVTFMTMNVFLISVIVGVVLSGPLIDKFGVMKAYIGGLIMISIGALLIPIIGSSSVGMIFIRVIQGLGAGPISGSGIPIAARFFPPKQRSLLIVLQGVAVSLGTAIGLSFIPEICKATQSWQATMAWLTPLCVIALIFSFIAALSEKKLEEDLYGIKTPYKEDLRTAILKPVTWIVIVCIAMITWIYGEFTVLIQGYLNAAPPIGLGYDLVAIGSLISTTSVIIAICSGLIGVMISEIFLKGNARPVVLSGFILGAIFIYLITIPTIALNHVILLICVCTIYFFLNFISPLVSGYIAKYYPKHITGTFGGLIRGISVLPLVVGFEAISKPLQTYGYHKSFSIIVVFAIIGALISIFLKPVKED